MKVGDKVITTRSYDSCPIGIKGVIVKKDGLDWAVDFKSNYFAGTHSCDGFLKHHTGYYISERSLRLASCIQK